jgi:hypothetical protein
LSFVLTVIFPFLLFPFSFLSILPDVPVWYAYRLDSRVKVRSPLSKLGVNSRPRFSRPLSDVEKEVEKEVKEVMEDKLEDEVED